MDFNFVNKEAFSHMWEGAKEMMIYSAPVYINTHLIQSCEDFKNIYPCMIDIIDTFLPRRVSWKELGGTFTLMNDIYTNVTYLVKICYSQENRVFF